MRWRKLISYLEILSRPIRDPASASEVRKRPKKRETSKSDRSVPGLDQIINLKHELVQLGARIDWAWIDAEIAPLYSDKGRPGIESRFVIGLLLLKHIYGLSDEDVCERWVYDPYFQHFTGEEFFQHTFPHERSDLSHWRKRLGDKLELLLAESLRVAHDSGALRTSATWRGSRSTPPCSPRISLSRPTPSSCMRRSRGSTSWRAASNVVARLEFFSLK